MEIEAAFQEAQVAARMIIENVFNIENLNPNEFLNSDRKTLKVTMTVKLSERPEDFTFFCFQCDLDSREIDKRVMMAGDFSFQFCIRLPRYLLNVADNIVDGIIMSPRKKRGEATMMSDFMKELSNTYGSLISTKKVLFNEVNGNDNKDNEDNKN